MEYNQDCISALVDICIDFIKYLKCLKEKGYISEEEFIKHSEYKLMFLQMMGNDR